MRTLDDIIADLPADRRDKVTARGRRLIQAANEALAIAEGRADPSTYVVHEPPPGATTPPRRRT